MATDPTRSTSDLRSVTIFGRLLSTRGAWVFFVLVALDVAAVVQASRGMLRLLAAADIGILVRPGRFVDALDERWPTLQRRDEIVEWQGEPVADGPALLERRLAQQPGPVSLVVLRGGERLAAQADATPVTPLAVAAVAIRLVSAALMLLIGMLLAAGGALLLGLPLVLGPRLGGSPTVLVGITAARGSGEEDCDHDQHAGPGELAPSVQHPGASRSRSPSERARGEVRRGRPGRDCAAAGACDGPRARKLLIAVVMRAPEAGESRGFAAAAG